MPSRLTKVSMGRFHQMRTHVKFQGIDQVNPYKTILILCFYYELLEQLTLTMSLFSLFLFYVSLFEILIAKQPLMLHVFPKP